MPDPVSTGLPLDRFADFARQNGVMGVLLMIGMLITWNMADRYIEHVMKLEKEWQQHQIDNDQVTVQILRSMEDAHQKQSAAVQEMRDTLRAHMR